MAFIPWSKLGSNVDLQSLGEGSWIDPETLPPGLQNTVKEGNEHSTPQSLELFCVCLMHNILKNLWQKGIYCFFGQEINKTLQFSPVLMCTADFVCLSLGGETPRNSPCIQQIHVYMYNLYKIHSACLNWGTLEGFLISLREKNTPFSTGNTSVVNRNTPLPQPKSHMQKSF